MTAAHITRETIDTGVLAFFSALTTGNAPAFKTATRNLKAWEDVAAEDQPALCLYRRSERSEKKRGLPTKWLLGYSLLLYVHSGAQNDSSVIVSQLMNPLLDAIEGALAVDDLSDDVCTLGGLVSHCAIDGEIQIHPGALGDEAAAIVPISVLTTA